MRRVPASSPVYDRFSAQEIQPPSAAFARALSLRSSAPSSACTADDAARRRDEATIRLTDYCLTNIPLGITSQFGARLVRLELVHCSIIQVERFKMERMPALRLLNLSHNLIATIGDALAGNGQLQVVYLDDNPLQELVDADLASLGAGVVALSLRQTLVQNMWSTVRVLRRMRSLRLLALGVGTSLLPDKKQAAAAGSPLQALQALLGDAALAEPPSHATKLLRPARIAQQEHYRAFLLAHLPALLLLDGIDVGDRARHIADIDAHFVNQLVGRCLHCTDSRQRPNQSSSSSMMDGACCRPLHSSRDVSSLSRALAARQAGDVRSQRFCQAADNLVARRCVLAGASRCLPLARRRLNFRVRQFEYHPTVPDEVLLGTTDAQVAVDSIADRTAADPLGWALAGSVDGQLSAHPLLGLHWLRRHSDRFLTGSASGAIQLFDKRLLRHGASFDDVPLEGLVQCYRPFAKLTCVQGNCSDQHFLASGDSTSVSMYDYETAAVVRSFRDVHTMQINVVKYANHSPHLFATSSFDRTVKLWDSRLPDPAAAVFTCTGKRSILMVCFSPHDGHLLSAGENNEVLQWDVNAGGRLQCAYDVQPKVTDGNWTRAYYLSSGRHVIVGSCKEDAIHVMCTQTGKTFRQVELSCPPALPPSPDLYCLSLRGDPLHPLRFSAIVANPASVYHPLQLVSFDLSQPDQLEHLF